MGAGFCSLYCKIHYIKVRYIEVWGYYNTWTCLSKASLLLMPKERLHTGQIKLVAKWWSTWISNSRTSSSSKVSSQMGHFNLLNMQKNNNNIIIIFREVDLLDFKRFFLEIPGFHTGFLSGQSSTIICKDNVTMDLFDHIFWF